MGGVGRHRGGEAGEGVRAGRAAVPGRERHAEAPRGAIQARAARPRQGSEGGSQPGPGHGPERPPTAPRVPGAEPFSTSQSRQALSAGPVAPGHLTATCPQQPHCTGAQVPSQSRPGGSWPLRPLLSSFPLALRVPPRGLACLSSGVPRDMGTPSGGRCAAHVLPCLLPGLETLDNLPVSVTQLPHL